MEVMMDWQPATVARQSGRRPTAFTSTFADWRRPWPGLEAIVVVDSTREIGTRTEHERRLYIASTACIGSST